MDEVLTVEHLTKTYGNKTAVDDLSLSVKKGTVFGLLGANGAGKSTTIECILGTKKADSGTVNVLGVNPLTKRKELLKGWAYNSRRHIIRKTSRLANCVR